MPKKDQFKEQLKVQNAIKEDMVCLMNSCVEGFNEDWDCSTSEGRLGFVPMYEALQRIAQTYGIDVRKAKEI